MTTALSVLGAAAKAEVEVVGANREKMGEFGTSEESGSLVRLMTGGELILGFIVGKPASDFKSTYISLEGSDKTYRVPANLASAFIRTDWYDMVIFETEKDKISKIRLQYPARELIIEREITESVVDIDQAPEISLGDWQGTMPYKFRVKEENIDPILDIMTNLTAIGIPAQNFEGTGLDKNNIIIEAIGEGVSNTIMIGGLVPVEEEEEARFYYAKRADSDNIYLITKEQGDELEKNIRDLQQ